MNREQQMQAKIENLEALLLKKEEKINELEKLNNWYIEQLKLRQRQKYGVSKEA